MKDFLKIPKTQKGIETVNNILSAATQLFYEKGYYGTNIKDITNLAGVGTGTFYLYFNSKVDLYRYLLLQFSHSIRRSLSEKAKGCSTRREMERKGIIAWLEYANEHPYVYNIIYESLYIDRSLFIDYYDIFSSSYSRGLSIAQKNGEVPDIDLEVLSYSLMGITNFLGLKYCIFDDGHANYEHIADEVMRVLEHGMFSERTTEEQPVIEKQPAKMNFRIEVDYDFLKSTESVNGENEDNEEHNS